MSNSLLEVRGLTKEYKGFKLGPVDLVIEPGEIVGMVGANGAGKTTMMKCILGLAKASGGQMAIFGQPAPKGATAKMRDGMGIVLDTFNFPKEFKFKDIGFLMGSAYSNWNQAIFEHYAAELGVDSFKNVESLSRGMGMKLSMAIALAHSPKLLLLDEATAGLDPMVRDDVLDMIRHYIIEHDAGVLLCTHITSDLEKIADKVICLNAGSVEFCVERDVITDLAGIARCRQVDLDALAEDGAFAEWQPRIIREPYGIDVLVPDRFDFTKRYPEIPCDRCSIEEYMRFSLKGETR